MRESLSFHGIHPVSRAGLREIVRELSKPIERRLASLQPDAARMETDIHKNPAHHLYRVSLRLRVPRQVLAASEEGHDLASVLVAAFEDLERRTEKYIERLRGSHQRRRSPGYRRSAMGESAGRAIE